jgi:hypothetical protein
VIYPPPPPTKKVDQPRFERETSSKDVRRKRHTPRPQALYKCVSIDLIYINEMILAAPFDNSSQVKGHRRSLEQQKENLRVLFLPRGRARRAAVEREKIRIDSRADDLRIAAEIGQAQHIAILHEL